MKISSAKYEGRMILKKGFRAFVYGVDNKQKLANSWQEYEDLVGSGLWFSSKQDSESAVQKIIDKSGSKSSESTGKDSNASQNTSDKTPLEIKSKIKKIKKKRKNKGKDKE